MIDDLEAFRLDAAALAEIDRQIAASMPLPEPGQLVGELQAYSPDVTIGIPAAIMLLAIHRGCLAAEAQDELFAAMRAGELDVKVPE